MFELGVYQLRSVSELIITDLLPLRTKCARTVMGNEVLESLDLVGTAIFKNRSPVQICQTSCGVVIAKNM